MSEPDFSQVMSRIKEAGQRQIEAAIKAVDEFGEQVLGQAKQLAPVGGGIYSPNDPAPGTLAASDSSTPAELNGKMIEKKIGFNTKYAAVQHEDLTLRHEQGQGKYLEKPMIEMNPKFGPFVAKRVKAALGE